jgi:hypothetical protein
MDHAKNYRAVEKRCAVVLESLHLPISAEQVLEILVRNKFTNIEIDIIALARQFIGKTRYERGVKHLEAPHIVDCSSFMKWLYGQRGFWLPRLAIQQREDGLLVDQSELTTHDLVFIAGRFGFYHDNPADSVSHVGIVTPERTIIHAERRSGSAVEVPLDEFIGKKKFRGARRYFPTNQRVLTFQVPDNFIIETADDIRYLILRDPSVVSLIN